MKTPLLRLRRITRAFAELRDYAGRRTSADPSKTRVAAAILSVRESQIFWLTVAGCGTGDVAARLRISVRTVEKHQENIRLRLADTVLAGLVDLRGGPAPGFGLWLRAIERQLCAIVRDFACNDRREDRNLVGVIREVRQARRVFEGASVE